MPTKRIRILKQQTLKKKIIQQIKKVKKNKKDQILSKFKEIQW